MDMPSALPPQLLPVSGSYMVQADNEDSVKVAPTRPSGSIAFYFRNWPFPVDMLEQVPGDSDMRSWQEKLVQYREASQALMSAQTQSKTEAVATGTSPEISPTGDQDVQTRPMDAAGTAARGSKTAMLPDGISPDQTGPDQIGTVSPLSQAATVEADGSAAGQTAAHSN